MAKNKDKQPAPEGQGRMTRKFVEQIVTALLLLMLIVSAFTLFSSRGKATPEVIAISQVAQDVAGGKVSKLAVKGEEITITYRSTGSSTEQLEKTSKKEAEASLSETLKNYGVTTEQLAPVAITVEEQSSLSFWLISLAPFLLSILSILFIIWLLSRQMKGASMQAFSFGQSRARILDPNDQSQKVTFKDVAGVKEAKEELKEIVDFLKNPKKFLDIGARIPKGVLLMGGPGTGKTLLARAVAGEAHVPFMYLSGSEFVEMFVGVGASVTGDTPVLVKTEKDGIKLKTIAEVIDGYYKDDESDRVKKIDGLQTLGLAPLKTRFRGAQSKDKQFFGGSQWSNVQGVLRHRVNEIHTIHYLGGKIRTTGDHSVFIRDRNMIRAKKASELKAGDILVNLPFKVRGAFIPGLGTTHSVRQHSFEKDEIATSLDLYGGELVESEKKYSYALEMSGVMSQYAIAEKVGVSQATVGNWQNSVHRPQFLTNNLIAAGAPSQVLVTTGLLRLMGYYAAEGRTEKYYTQFVFGLHEKNLHADCASLIRESFKLEPQFREISETNSFRINISSPIVARFFKKHLGTGSKSKHLPQFLWTASKDQFLAFLDGYSRGDGYTTKDGKLSITSVSQQIIRELSWLAGMHGIQTGVRKMIIPPGRTINGGKPLPETIAWNLIIGKSSHPFRLYEGAADQFKKPVVQKVEKEPYDGFVYDFCGCDHEAFFGGEKPILLHNSRVRDLFKMAKSVAPAIIFIDEIDAIGRHRGSGMGGGNDEREQTLNQILVEMDGFEPTEKLIVMAATNRPDVLDPALLRPGRFDRRVTLDAPDLKDREEILAIHAKKKPLGEDVNLHTIAERTPGFSGADLASLMNESAILAAREDRKKVTQYDLIRSVEKVMLGPERKSHILSKQEKKITAYHEMGHALAASVLPNSDPVHKVSIISRGYAAGYTLKLPLEDRRLQSRKEFLDDIAVSLAGYAAEKMIFGDITTGASNDIAVSSSLARAMVTRYGMSEKIGPVSFEAEAKTVNSPIVVSDRYSSEATGAAIDGEVSRIMTEALARANEVLTNHKKALDMLADELIKLETLEREDFEKLLILNGIKPKTKPVDEPAEEISIVPDGIEKEIA